MFEVGVVAEFSATHQLRGDFGPAAQRHGHRYRVEVTARGNTLRPDGTLCDLAQLEARTSTTVAGLNDRNLDELAEFARKNSTAEAVARYIFDQIAPGLAKDGLATLVVRVWESPIAWAGYAGQIGEPGASTG